MNQGPVYVREGCELPEGVDIDRIVTASGVSSSAHPKGAPGDYIVRNPITHLDGLQARLVDTWEACGRDEA